MSQGSPSEPRQNDPDRGPRWFVAGSPVAFEGRDMSSKFRRLVAALALVLGLVTFAPGGIAAAQETVNQGTISGRVLDQQGAAVPGALVTARHTATNVTVDATTRCRRTLPLSLSENRPVRTESAASGIQGECARDGAQCGLGVRSLDRSRGRRHRGRRHGGRRRPRRSKPPAARSSARCRRRRSRTCR